MWCWTDVKKKIENANWINVVSASFRQCWNNNVYQMSIIQGWNNEVFLPLDLLWKKVENANSINFVSTTFELRWSHEVHWTSIIQRWNYGYIKIRTFIPCILAWNQNPIFALRAEILAKVDKTFRSRNSMSSARDLKKKHRHSIGERLLFTLP